jgi:hypothetical protein
MMGVNDVNQATSKANFISSYTSALNSARDNNIIPVIIKILPWSSDSNAQCAQILDWNNSLATLVQSYEKYVLVDSTATIGLDRDGLPPGNLCQQKLEYYGDGIHLNAAGYAAIAQDVYNAIMASNWVSDCNGSLSDCQAKVTAASSGDTVTIAPGTYTWSGTLNMKAGVTLQGAPNLATQINTSGQAISFDSANNCGIIGIHFNSSGGYTIAGQGTGIRIGQNSFTGSASIAIYFTDIFHNTGVVYGNSFTGVETTVLYVRGSALGTGAGEFGTYIDFGSSDWVYFEGNTIDSPNDMTELIETQYGGKIVSRWNTINGSWGQVWEQHNTVTACSTYGFGGRAHEVYYNLMQPTGGGAHGNDDPMNLRDGTGMYYGNVYDYHLAGSIKGWTMTPYRQEDNCIANHPTLIDWACSSDYGAGYLAACCETSYINDPYQGEGYPCVGVASGPIHNPHSEGVREPIYFWNNKKTADGTTMVDHTDVTTTASAWAMALDRDYCVSTTGKPPSCGGVTLTYTPYTCPHPLAGSGSCNPAIVGASGYVLGAGVSPSYHENTIIIWSELDVAKNN